jgi:hypothetical protein
MRVLFQCHALSGLALPSTLSTANFFNYHNLSRAKGQIITNVTISYDGKKKSPTFMS